MKLILTKFQTKRIVALLNVDLPILYCHTNCIYYSHWSRNSFPYFNINTYSLNHSKFYFNNDE